MIDVIKVLYKGRLGAQPKNGNQYNKKGNQRWNLPPFAVIFQILFININRSSEAFHQFNASHDEDDYGCEH
jgi:hypothetical protein